MSKTKSKTKTFHFPVAPSMRQDGPWYVVDRDSVTWRGYDVDADPSTFVALSHSWGVDQDAVFVQTAKKRGIDRKSFRLLNPLFAIDAAAVYDWKGRVQSPSAIADPKTFEILDSGVVLCEDELIPNAEFMGYAKDKHFVWFHDQMSGRTGPIKSADIQTFRSFRNGFGADAQSVFRGKTKLPNADPSTWTYLGHGYSRDHARVWFHNRPIREVDRDRFFVLNLPSVTGLATDGARFFTNDSQISSKQFEKAIREAINSCNKQSKCLEDI